MFRFYLDNTLVSNPINWADFTETIEWDEILKGVFPKYEIKLSFTGDAYVYLLGQRDSYGYCKDIVLKVDQECFPGDGYATELNGIITISDCRFHENICMVECDVMDNNYVAKIFNNKSKKAYLNVGRSQNDTTITSCTFDAIQIFIPSTGVFSGAITRKVFNLKDAFRFLIHFMTDGIVGFESTFLSTVADNYRIEGMRLTTGHELRLHDLATAPFICFQDLFHEVDIKYPIGFTMIKVAGVPTLKLENAAYFRNETSSITVSNINNLVSSFNNELLYSSVKFGSTWLDYDGYQYNYAQIRFFNFADEEYHLQGTCNIDKALDLTGFIISDTNLIEGLVATDIDNDTYDTDLVWVQIDSATLKAVSSPDPTSLNLPRFYNDKLTNNNIAERHNLQGNIALFLGNNNDAFRSENNILQDVTADFFVPITNSANIFSSTIAFQNDSVLPNFDTNGNYNNVLFKFVSPANGNYNFESNIVMLLTVGSPSVQLITDTVIMQVCYNIYDGGGGFLRTEFCPQYNYIPGLTSISTFNIFGSKNVYIPAGGWAICLVSAIATANNNIFYLSNILTTSYFLCNQTHNGGGVYDYAAPGDYFVSRFEFDAPLSKTNYDLMKVDLAKSITINIDGKHNKTTWIRKTVRKPASGEMNWEQISSTNNS